MLTSRPVEASAAEYFAAFSAPDIIILEAKNWSNRVGSEELREQRKLIVITTSELQALADTDQLVRLIKTKLCDLALRAR